VFVTSFPAKQFQAGVPGKIYISLTWVRVKKFHISETIAFQRLNFIPEFGILFCHFHLKKISSKKDRRGNTEEVNAKKFKNLG